MARIKIAAPLNFPFSCNIPIRITDLNYGGHVGNDTFLGLIHEARMQFLKSFNYAELDFAGIGLIMSDVIIEFRNELFYGDNLVASVAVGDFSNAGFDIYYKLERHANGVSKIVALAKTGMTGYDYARKKVAPIPEEAKIKLQQG
jgi:acyl-CoA thioester hydrolase